MKKELFLLMILNMLSSIGYSLMTPLYPPIAKLHNLSDSLTGLVFASYSIGNAIIIPFSPFFFARISKNKLLNFSLSIEAVCAIIFGLLEYISNEQAFAIISFTSRFTQGIAAGFSATIIYALAVYYSEENGINVSMGLLELGFSLGQSLGPIAGTFIYHFSGYKYPFLLFGLCRLICVIAIRQLQYIDSPYKKINFCQIVFNKNIMLSFIAIMINLSTINFFYPVLSNHLQQKFNLPLEISSVFFVIQVVSYFVFIQAISKIKLFIGIKLTMSFGLLFNFFIVSFLAPAAYLPQNIIIVVIGLSLIGLTEALISIPSLEDFIMTLNSVLQLETLISSDYASALYNLAVNLGDSFGPIIGGYLTETKGFEYACFIIGVINIVIYALFIMGNVKAIHNQLTDINLSQSIEEDSSSFIKRKHSDRVNNNNTFSNEETGDDDQVNDYNTNNYYDTDNNDVYSYSKDTTINKFYIGFAKKYHSKKLSHKMSFLENNNQ